MYGLRLNFNFYFLCQMWSNLSPSAQARVSFVGGDFLAGTLEDSKLPSGHSSYIIRNALHNWTDDVVVSILRRIREAMLATPTKPPANSRLFVCEMLLAKNNTTFMHSTSMHLLTLNKGRTRTKDEMFRLVGESGFEIVAVHKMRAVSTIIEARPFT